MKSIVIQTSTTTHMYSITIQDNHFNRLSSFCLNKETKKAAGLLEWNLFFC